MQLIAMPFNIFAPFYSYLAPPSVHQCVLDQIPIPLIARITAK